MAHGKEGSLIYLEGDLNWNEGKVKCSMMLDSGADSSVISRMLVDRFKIPVETSPVPWGIKFIVLPNDGIEIILGMDWMLKSKVSIHPSGEPHIMFEEELMPWETVNYHTIDAEIKRDSVIGSNRSKMIIQLRPDLKRCAMNQRFLNKIWVFRKLKWNS